MSNRIKHNRRHRQDKKPRHKIGKRVVKSDFEYNSYIAIKANLPKKATIDYETEKLRYIVEKDYLPDIIVTFKDESKLYIECKGYFPYGDRDKMIQVKKCNPDLDIRLLFYRNNPSQLGKGSKIRPSEWAEKNDFKYAIGEIPRDWLYEKENSNNE